VVVVRFPCLVTVVVAVVVVFWLQFVFLSMTAWSQGILQLKIAVGGTWCMVDSENAGDAIRSGSGLGFDLERCGTRTQGFTQRCRDARRRNRREEPTGLLKWLENLRRTKIAPQADDVAEKR